MDHPWLKQLEPSAAAAIARLRTRQAASRFPAWPLPAYDPGDRELRIFFDIASYPTHMSSEGGQFQFGLRQAGYLLYGQHFDPPFNCADVSAVCEHCRPMVAILQDKRKWDAGHPDSLVKDEAFRNITAVAGDSAIFRLTVWKDAWFRRRYHHTAHREWQPHAYITYYHDDLISYFSPWINRKQLIRIHHSVDSTEIPLFSADRQATTLVSGAGGGHVYPLRSRAIKAVQRGKLRHAVVLPHPGYHARGTNTPEFLQRLSRHRTALCTASIFGCALRKIIEAVACGCTPITNLPAADPLPVIDEALVRVSSDITIPQLQGVMCAENDYYDLDLRRYWAVRAREYYDYRATGQRLAHAIETKRRDW